MTDLAVENKSGFVIDDTSQLKNALTRPSASPGHPSYWWNVFDALKIDNPQDGFI